MQSMKIGNKQNSDTTRVCCCNGQGFSSLYKVHLSLFFCCDYLWNIKLSNCTKNCSRMEKKMGPIIC